MPKPGSTTARPVKRAKAKKPWHKGTFDTQSARVRAAANRNPSTICWRCKRTMAEIRKDKPHAKWQAGHVVDGQVNGVLLAECSPCNASHGAAMGNRKRSPRPNPSRSW